LRQSSARFQSLLASTLAKKQLSTIHNKFNIHLGSFLVTTLIKKKLKFKTTLKKNKSRYRKKQNSFYKNRVASFSVISPKLIGTFIRSLLVKTDKSSVVPETTNLNGGIITVLRLLLKPLKKIPLGIKIVCSGK